MDRTDNTDAVHVKSVLDENIKKLIAAGIPDYGTLSLSAHFVEGQIARVEIGQSVSRRVVGVPRSGASR